MDTSHNVYVADSLNNRIRKITPAGVVSTLAGAGGAGAPGYVNGTGATAEFSTLSSIAIDTSGNLYVVEQNNHRIRKITSTNVVSTIAGNGSAGYVDGTAATARFNKPFGVSVDNSGNVYVTDQSNHRVRKISPDGIVNTLAGTGVLGTADGMGTTAQFNNPSGIALDSSGNLFIADKDNHLIRKISPSGKVSTVAGTGILGSANGMGTMAQFNTPQGVALDTSGNLFVADSFNNMIRQISSAGQVSILAGVGSQGFIDGSGNTATFNHPLGLAVDSSNNLYISDTNNNRIRKIIPI